MNQSSPNKTHLPGTLTLRFGDIGDYVELVQRRLIELSLLQEDQVSGEYDERTSGAVKHFQGLNGLTDDAVVGPKTARALKLTESTVSSSSSDEQEEDIAVANEEELQAARLREEQAAQAEAERLAEQEHLMEENLTAMKNKEAGEAKVEGREEAAEQLKAAAPPANPFAKKEDLAAAQEKLHNKHEAMEEMLDQQANLSQPAQEAAPEPVPSAQSTAQDMQDMSAQLQEQVPQMAQAQGAEAIILDGAGFEALQARIEAKLDQPTLQDVKVTGTKLAAAGVKESAVPAEFDIGKGAAPAIARQEQQQMEIG